MSGSNATGPNETSLQTFTLAAGALDAAEGAGALGVALGTGLGEGLACWFALAF